MEPKLVTKLYRKFHFSREIRRSRHESQALQPPIDPSAGVPDMVRRFTGCCLGTSGCQGRQIKPRQHLNFIDPLSQLIVEVNSAARRRAVEWIDTRQALSSEGARTGCAESSDTLEAVRPRNT